VQIEFEIGDEDSNHKQELRGNMRTPLQLTSLRNAFHIYFSGRKERTGIKTKLLNKLGRK
jgi:hypothetical protein